MTLKQQLIDTGLFVERGTSPEDRSTSLFIEGVKPKDHIHRAMARLSFDSAGELVAVRTWIEVTGP